jgi:predicted MFS family arabinose efflux permease
VLFAVAPGPKGLSEVGYGVIITAFACGAMPVGAVLGGLIAEALGLRAVFILAAAASLALLSFRRYLRDQDLDAAELAVQGPSSTGRHRRRPGSM